MFTRKRLISIYKLHQLGDNTGTHKLRMGKFFTSASVYILLLAYIALSMGTWCLLVEARIPNFSAIQGTNFSMFQFLDSFNLVGANFENFQLASLSTSPLWGKAFLSFRLRWCLFILFNTEYNFFSA